MIWYLTVIENQTFNVTLSLHFRQRFSAHQAVDPVAHPKLSHGAQRWHGDTADWLHLATAPVANMVWAGESAEALASLVPGWGLASEVEGLPSPDDEAVFADWF